jgi:hypothetical protein
VNQVAQINPLGVNLIAQLKGLWMNFEVQYTLHGLFALRVQNTEDYPLKACLEGYF